MASKLSLFLAELKRRKVTRVAFVYAVVGLGVIEGASMILPTLRLEAAYPFIVILVLFGFPVALVLAWALEVTPDGLQPTTDLTPDQLAAETPERSGAGSWILAGVGLVVVLTAGYFVFFGGNGEAASVEERIVVFPFENLTGDPNLDELGEAAAYWITDGLSRTGGVRVVETNNVLQLLQVREEGATNREIASSLGATTSIAGALTRLGEGLELTAQITDLATGEVRHSFDAVGDLDEPMGVVEALRQKVMGALALSVNRVFAEAVHRIPSYEAYQAMAHAMEEFSDRDRAGAIPHFRRAHQLDTTFLTPLIWAIGASMNEGKWDLVDSLVGFLEPRTGRLNPVERLQFEWFASARLADMQGELDAMRALSDQNPSFYGYDLGTTALQANRPEEALRALSQVDPDHPYWGRFPQVWQHLVRANHRTGRYAEALEAALEGRRRFPEDLELMRLQVRALAALGRVEEGRPLLDSMEVMDPGVSGSPGYFFRGLSADLARMGFPEESEALAGRSLRWYVTRDPEGYQEGRARALLLAGRPEEAMSLLDPLLEDHSEDLGLQGLLGVVLARTGDREGALAHATWCAELDRPHLRGEDSYWQAAILAHVGEREEAIRLLRQSLREGWSYFYLHADPSFTPLWGFEPFEQLLAPRG